MLCSSGFLITYSDELIGMEQCSNAQSEIKQCSEARLRLEDCEVSSHLSSQLNCDASLSSQGKGTMKGKMRE